MNRQHRDQWSAHLRSWALAYARHGWAVFPLAAGFKIPALSRKQGGRGCLDATTDTNTVNCMWDRFPLANVGLATGETSGIAVLDVDVKSNGIDTLAALIVRHGQLAVGPVAATPSGGRHYLFTWRAGLRCSAGQIGPGLDVRSDGGYIVAAPSVLPGGRYEWLVHPRTALTGWPEWLVPTPPPARPIHDEQALRAAEPDKVLAGLVRAVAEAPQGKRNSLLFWAGVKLAEKAAAGQLPLDMGAAALLDGAARVGLPEYEANRTLQSALRRIGAVNA